MREILFRGKTIKSMWADSEWVYGSLVIDGDNAFIVTENDYSNSYTDDRGVYDGDMTKVDITTAEQYTGLTDKNGKKIFEGDIVNVNTNKDTLCHRYEGRNLVIRFDEYHRFVASGRLEYPLCNHYEWEVIGNIHDNPELLRTPQNDEVK